MINLIYFEIPNQYYNIKYIIVQYILIIRQHLGHADYFLQLYTYGFNE